MKKTVYEMILEERAKLPKVNVKIVDRTEENPMVYIKVIDQTEE